MCNLCEAICGLELTIEGRDVVGVRGNPADPLSRGHVCPKGVAIADVYADPDRLRRPVRRGGDGWEEIGWDEAFDLVADRLAGVINEHGDDAVGVYLGNPNAHSLGSMTHGTAMFKAFRTRNRFSATSVDQLPHQLVAHLMFGHQLFLPMPDIDRTSWFLVLGANPMASNGSLMTVPDFPQRVARPPRPRRAHGRARPAPHRDRQGRRRAPLRPPRHRRVVLLAMLHVLTVEASTPRACRRTSTGSRRVVDLGRRLHPRARRGRSAACPPTRSAGSRASSRRPTRGVVYGRIGVSAEPVGHRVPVGGQLPQRR